MMTLLAGIGLWALLVDIIVIAILVGLVETRHPIAASLVVFIVWPAAIWAMTGFSFNVYYVIWDNPMSFLFFIVAYVIIGVLWSVGKWALYINTDEVKAKSRQYYDDKTKRDESYDRYTLLTDNLSPISITNATNYSRLLRWLAWWPVSAASTLFREFFIKLFENLFNLMKGIYTELARGVVDRVVPATPPVSAPPKPDVADGSPPPPAY